jgi:DNA-binding PadR family transcriptional regulator
MMILGLVRWLQPVHGYDVRRELMSWDVDRWANIQPGSIYHALRKLTDEGMLAEVATERVGSRPARTTYRMTPAGDREFGELLRRYWWEYKDPIDPFAAAFALLPALPRAEAVAALRNRARLLKGQVAQLQLKLGGSPEHAATGHRPVHVVWTLELFGAHAEAEIAWCRRIADRIEAGAGTHVGEVDPDEMGRRWREAIAAEFGPVAAGLDPIAAESGPIPDNEQ